MCIYIYICNLRADPKHNCLATIVVESLLCKFKAKGPGEGLKYVFLLFLLTSGSMLVLGVDIGSVGLVVIDFE